MLQKLSNSLRNDLDPDPFFLVRIQDPGSGSALEKNGIYPNHCFTLILMRKRILDPYWEKMDPDLDPGHNHFFQIYWICYAKQNRKNIFLLFTLIFILKLDEPMRDQQIFIIFPFFNSSELKTLVLNILNPDQLINLEINNKRITCII